MKVLFLTQTSQIGASARYRVYQFLDYLKEDKVDFSVLPAVSDRLLDKYHSSGIFLTKFQYYGYQLLKRIWDIGKVNKFDVIFMQRDFIIHAYPLIEKIMALINKNIIFDFDDAIYLYPPSKRKGIFFNLLWDKKKIERIISLSKHVIVANNYLKEYAKKFSDDVTVIPTSVDLRSYRSFDNPKINLNNKIKIGWVGSQVTFVYLEKLFSVFAELAKKYRIELRILGAKGPSVDGLEISYKDWDLETEIKEISAFDIGVMPLTDDAWSRGKSATKLLQYMAAGVPAIASPVGANKEIIKDGVNGFLAENEDAWLRIMQQLIENRGLREGVVRNARKDVETLYSVQANATKFKDVIKKVAMGV